MITKCAVMAECLTSKQEDDDVFIRRLSKLKELGLNQIFSEKQAQLLINNLETTRKNLIEEGDDFFVETTQEGLCSKEIGCYKIEELDSLIKKISSLK